MKKTKSNIENATSRNRLLVRAFVIYACITVTGIAVLLRVLDLQFFKREKIEQQRQPMIASRIIPVEHGSILSRNFAPLVKRTALFTVSMDPHPFKLNKKNNIFIKEYLLSNHVFDSCVVVLSDSLEALFGTAASTWEKRLRDARAKENLHYFILNNRVNILQKERIVKFPLFDKEAEKRYHYNILDIQQNKEEVNYPYGDLAKRTLGEVKEYIVKVKDLTGREQDILKRDLTGLEGFFEKELSGVSGKKMTKTVSNIIIDMNDPSDILPQNGLDVVTTLDMTIQDIAHKSLLNNMKNHEADEGCVIVMEVETGDILAIANISQDRNGAYRETKNVALDEYEPGSTFKTAGLLVALNDEKITPNTKIQIAYKSGRTATVGVRNVTDDVVIDKNEAPVWEILARSSNVGTTRAIYNSYNAHQQQFFDGLCRLGFCDTIIFPVIGGKKCPLLHSPSHPMWSKSTISTVPMGYEVKVTPLHLLTFYNAIANDGKMVAPRLVSELRSGEQTVQKFDVIVLREKICSDQALQQIRGMLDSVITYTRGTGYKGFKGSLYTIAGKTGTSTDYTREAKGKNLNNASFCGYFPADNPKYSCIVLIKRPRTGGSHGGSVAIPVFRDIADKLYATDFKLMPEAEPSIQDSANFDLVAKSRISALDTIFKTVHFQMFERNNATWGYVHLKNKTAVVEQVSFSDKMMPDVTEMSPTDAVFVLEKVGLAVEIKGYGRVKRQTPEANTLIIKGQKAILELGI